MTDYSGRSVVVVGAAGALGGALAAAFAISIPTIRDVLKQRTWVEAEPVPDHQPSITSPALEPPETPR